LERRQSKWSGVGGKMRNNAITESLADRDLYACYGPPSCSGDMHTHATVFISLDDILPPWHHALKRNRSSHLEGLRHWEGVGDAP